jgi:hypothetical protein
LEGNSEGIDDGAKLPVGALLGKLEGKELVVGDELG